MVSSDLDELISMSDRIAVMRNGKIVTIVNAKEVTEQELLQYFLGINQTGELTNQLLRAAIRKKLLANQWSFLLIVVIVLSIVAGSVNARYWWMGNLSNLLGQISVLSLVACGATILIISGNFHISVGANIGLSSVVMAMLMRNGVFPPLAAFIGVLVSIVCAFLIGAASILFQAPSFIISLAAIGVFQGIALFVTQGTIQTIYGHFRPWGERRKLFNVLPLLFIIALAGYGVTHFILARTPAALRVRHRE